MEKDMLLKKLVNTGVYDLNFHSSLTSDNGNKISIQGKNIGHSAFLYDRLSTYLFSLNVPFKLATINRYALLNTHKEQSHKAMTIYCPDGMCFKQLCEDVYNLTLMYKGWYDIKIPTSYIHYAGGLFTRNDRDENGNYIPANNN